MRKYKMVEIDGRVVHLVSEPVLEYLQGLIDFLKILAQDSPFPWWVRPWDLLSRAYVRKVGENKWSMHFRGDTWEDDRLGAHELGHVVGLKHTGEFPGDAAYLLGDDYSWTVMHPWGPFRQRDPHGLVPMYRKIKPFEWKA